MSFKIRPTTGKRVLMATTGVQNIGDPGSDCCCGVKPLSCPSKCTQIGICDYIFSMFPPSTLPPFSPRFCNDQMNGLWQYLASEDDRYCLWKIGPSEGVDFPAQMLGDQQIDVDPATSIMTLDSMTDILSMELWTTDGDLLWAGDSLPQGTILYRRDDAAGGDCESTLTVRVGCTFELFVFPPDCTTTAIEITLGGTMSSGCPDYLSNGPYFLSATAVGSCTFTLDLFSPTRSITVKRGAGFNNFVGDIGSDADGYVKAVFQAPGCGKKANVPDVGTSFKPSHDAFANRTFVRTG